MSSMALVKDTQLFIYETVFEPFLQVNKEMSNELVEKCKDMKEFPLDNIYNESDKIISILSIEA